MSFEELIKLGKRSIKFKKINRYIKAGDCTCVIESKSNKRYVGHSYSFSNFGYCAEQAALIAMFNDGEYEISKIVTVSKTGDIIPPCGRCLELISQTTNSENIEIALSKYVVKKMHDVYPYDWKRTENYNIGMPLASNDPYNLKRFIIAQEEYFETALKEIKEGEKKTHWIWYIFPIHKCLANNVKANYYGISSLAEAKEYFSNEFLRRNLITASSALLSISSSDLITVFGLNDYKKIQSCITLFYKCTHEEIFIKLLDKCYNGQFEQKTISAIDREIEHE